MPSKKSIAATIVLAVAAAGYVTERASWSETAPKAATAAPAIPGMPVPVADVTKKTIPIFMEYSARVESIRNVTLQAKISGYVQEQVAADGADVHQGDLLYRIDPSDYQAALDQAGAQVERDIAALDYAKTTLDRGADLVKTGALAKDAYEQRSSAQRQADATLRADLAAAREASINLKRTEIRAPFNGRLGRNQAPVGTLINSSGATVNTLVQLDPIYVAFNPSETDLAEIEKARTTGKVATDVLVPGDTTATHHGDLTFIDNTVDRATGTIGLRATIANQDFSLLPGQYVRVRVHLREQPDTLLVPQAAIGSSQFGKFVYVVGEGNKAEMRPVTLGTIEGDQVAVLKGLSEQDKVVTGNLQKIGPGSPLQPLPAAKSGS
jgi:multidrug efflux system membrane fusion protein